MRLSMVAIGMNRAGSNRNIVTFGFEYCEADFRFDWLNFGQGSNTVGFEREPKGRNRGTGEGSCWNLSALNCGSSNTCNVKTS